MKPLLLVLLAAPCLVCSPAEQPSSKTEKATQPLLCGPEQIGEEALRKAGTLENGAAVLPNNRLVTPAGTSAKTGRWPIGLAVNAAGTRAYVTHVDDRPNGLMVLDLVEHKAIQSFYLKSAFRGVVLSPDEKYLYVGAGFTGKVVRYSLDANGDVTTSDELALGGYIADLALSADGGTLYAVSNTTSSVHVVDTASFTPKAKFKAGQFPYDMVLADNVLWISNVATSTVIALDAASGKLLATIAVPKGPEAMALSPDGKELFVACSDADAIAVIDTASRKLARTIDQSGDPMLRRHGNVNGIAVSPDGKRVFASHAGFNKVTVVDRESGETAGAIPVGWYPTEVLAREQGLYVLSSKGLGSIEGQLNPKAGLLSVIPWPDEATLSAMTAKVEANNSAGSRFFTGQCAPEQIPVLAGKGKSPIEHVVLIVRENKTYDMLLGDFERGDGDPALVVFPEPITPNFHKAAREFVNMDNFYSNPENSVQGHMWTTTAHCNDFVEKTWHDQIPLAGYEPAGIADAPSIFDNCFANGVGFRVYGELPSFAKYLFDKYFDEFDNKYPFWNQNIKDVDKAAEFIRELNLGIFEAFTYIVLPNDHTYGGKAGKRTPRSMVADNDRATAMILEAITASPYWPSTVVFIIEDDPQGTGDHVEAHRSVCVVVSPWVRRAYTSSIHYDVPSLYRTIELILGLPPMGKNDAYAPPMLDIWVDGTNEKPDYTPFVGVPVDVPEDEFNPKGNPIEALTAHCTFDEVDGCPGLGRALWKAMRGEEEPPPYARGIDL